MEGAEAHRSCSDEAEMDHLLAVTFNELGAADDVLQRLRSLEAKHLVELEDACVAQRDREGNLYLKQAIGGRLADALPGHFWHHLIGHILHHGSRPDENSTPTPHYGLSHKFVREATEKLAPGTSALLVVVREASVDPMVESLKGYRGALLRCGLPAGEREKLRAAMTPLSQVPPAKELNRVAALANQREAVASLHQHEVLQAERHRRIARLQSQHLAPHELEAIIYRCTEAARHGETRALVFRFPSELCTDGGRAINNGEENWPQTLTGQAADFYRHWQETLRPAGYRLRAAILDYPQGLPGDAGFTLSWDGNAPT
jgi:uncharacterized membrane protein